MKNILRFLVLSTVLGLTAMPVLADGPGGGDPPPPPNNSSIITSSSGPSVISILLSYLGF